MRICIFLSFVAGYVRHVGVGWLFGVRFVSDIVPEGVQLERPYLVQPFNVPGLASSRRTST